MTRLLPRYTQPAIDPINQLEIAIARSEAKRQEAIDAMEAGGTPLGAEASNLRGIPVQAMGVGGTSPGTDPAAETIRRNTPRKRR